MEEIKAIEFIHVKEHRDVNVGRSDKKVDKK